MGKRTSHRTTLSSTTRSKPPKKSLGSLAAKTPLYVYRHLGLLVEDKHLHIPDWFKTAEERIMTAEVATKPNERRTTFRWMLLSTLTLDIRQGKFENVGGEFELVYHPEAIRRFNKRWEARVAILQTVLTREMGKTFVGRS